MPALSIILGRTLHAVCSELREGTIQLTKKHILWLTGIAGAVAVGVAVGISLRWPHLISPAIWLGLTIAGTGLLLGYFLSKPHWTPVLVCLGLGFATSYAIVTAVIFPNRDRRQPYVEFAESVRELVPVNQPIVLYGLKEDPLVYYLPGSVCRAESALELSQQLEGQGSVVVIADQALVPELAKGGYTLDAFPVPQSHLGDPVPLVLVKCTPQKIAASPMRR